MFVDIYTSPNTLVYTDICLEETGSFRYFLHTLETNVNI